ncbi:flavodoxin family protein [Legionella gresilensis]|uniref:flavodoxin family protein n=1 Tax=Legionella gresilensis TaxID=91823 RepID=UPI0010415207|nr:flavodoxin family protein [Legionella gresilensis]
MKAIILLGTLKKDGLSNTETLCDFFSAQLHKKGVKSEVIRLVSHTIMPGTYSTSMGKEDQWPTILNKMIKAQIIIFATPIWWGGQSSEIQRVIERLDGLHDEILLGKKSKLDGKVGGIIITGDSDGAEHIIGNLSNFFNAVGIILPPYSTLSVLSEKQKKGSNVDRCELMQEYHENYKKNADKMINQILKYIPCL